MALGEYKALIVKREGSRLYVTINRPEFKNAINLIPLSFKGQFQMPNAYFKRNRLHFNI